MTTLIYWSINETRKHARKIWERKTVLKLFLLHCYLHFFDEAPVWISMRLIELWFIGTFFIRAPHYSFHVHAVTLFCIRESRAKRRIVRVYIENQYLQEINSIKIHSCMIKRAVLLFYNIISIFSGEENIWNFWSLRVYWYKNYMLVYMLVWQIIYGAYYILSKEHEIFLLLIQITSISSNTNKYK